VTYFVIRAKDSYVRLYDLKFTPLFAIEDPHKSIMNQNVTQLSGVGDYVYDDGTLTMNAKAADGYSIKMNVNDSFNPTDFTNLLMDLSTTAEFDIQMELTNGNGDATMSFKNEFFNVFGLEGDFTALPAGNHVVDMNLIGYYEWNGGAVDNSTVKSVTITMMGEGTLTLKALQASRIEAINYVQDGATSSGSLEVQPPDPPKPDILQGDVNGDGEVSSQDARMLMLDTVIGGTLTDEQLAAADYNGDGKVNTQDARAMLLALILT